MICQEGNCLNDAEEGSDICFRHRVMTVGVKWHGGARLGRKSWNQSKTDFMMENFGTTSEKELAARGIERADSNTVKTNY